jgi:hypothetical protein
MKHATNNDAITSIPCDDASYVVTIDGRPYVGFVDRVCAEMAVAIWTGAVDGNGLPVPLHERERHGWPAVRGKLLEIVERDALFR